MAEAKAAKKTVKKVPARSATSVAGGAPKTEAKKVPKSTAPKGEGFAVIETGGKQYGVTTGDSFKIEKMIGDFKVGDSITFDKVLLSNDVVGAPYVAGAKVTATISEIGRNAKITVIKYKQKSRYFKKNGHRQPFFKVTIEKIS